MIAVRYFIIITTVSWHSYGLMDVTFIIIRDNFLRKFWEFESIDFIQCNSFVYQYSNYEYEHEIIVQTTLLLMWIVLHKIDCKSTNLFKKKYLLLTKDQLSVY